MIKSIDRLKKEIYDGFTLDLQQEQVHELVSQEDGVRAAVSARRVYDPLLFSEQIIQFTSKQYLFLRAYRLGTPLEEAALKAGMTEEQAERFLDKDKTQAWLKDRALKDHIKNEWEEPGKWWKEGDEALTHPKKWDRVQLEIWKEFGERIAPTREKPHLQPKIEINIDPSAVQEAFRRQNALEAELVSEKEPA